MIPCSRAALLLAHSHLSLHRSDVGSGTFSRPKPEVVATLPYAVVELEQVAACPPAGVAVLAVQLEDDSCAVRKVAQRDGASDPLSRSRSKVRRDECVVTIGWVRLFYGGVAIHAHHLAEALPSVVQGHGTPDMSVDLLGVAEQPCCGKFSNV